MQLYRLENGDLRVHQRFAAPSVYMDHWALREFSDNQELQDWFVKAFHAKGATFLLSFLNLAEFTGPSDARHAPATERFLDRLLPNVYLTNFDYLEAGDFEAQPELAGQRLCPPPDVSMMQWLGTRCHQAGGTITLQGIVALANQNRDHLGKHFLESNARIRDRWNEMRADPKFVKLARQSVPGTNRTATRVVMGELMRDLVLDSKAPITTNDVIDWQHTSIPILCCDFVLIDKKWELRASKLRRRVAAQNLALPLAQCFSKRNRGIYRFLQGLERFSP